jgi:hypothetical protein
MSSKMSFQPFKWKHKTDSPSANSQVYFFLEQLSNRWFLKIKKFSRGKYVNVDPESINMPKGPKGSSSWWILELPIVIYPTPFKLYRFLWVEYDVFTGFEFAFPLWSSSFSFPIVITPPLGPKQRLNLSSSPLKPWCFAYKSYKSEEVL